MPRKLLVCAVPGLKSDLEQWQALGARIEAGDMFGDYDEVRWRFFDHGLHPMGRRGMMAAALDVGAWISDEQRSFGADDIFLVGHSAGALLVRQAWLNAVDPRQSEHSPAPWGARVRRFVLFAGVSRGVDFERSVPLRLLTRAVELIPGRFTFEDCMRGSAFITNLRIGWMRYLAGLDPARAPVMIQLLGTRDSTVSREDSLDLDIFPTDRPINVGGASHADLYHVKGGRDPQARFRTIIEAFTAPPPAAPPRSAQVATDRQVLMIVHGIRASNIDDWVSRAKARAQTLWPGIVIAAPTYGYLSALRFALPNVRRRYGRFFRDFYTEVISKHRSAQISVLCHSNGTYALGESLRMFSAIHLERVALAGSVLPTRYDWSRLIDAGRVKAVRNDGGDRDYPVALLCNGLRGLMMRDVGTAGFDGFDRGPTTEVRFHEGGHGCMLTDQNLTSMIQFLMDQPHPQPRTAPIRRGVRTFSRLMVYLMPAVVIGVASAVALSWLVWGWVGLLAALGLLALVLILLDSV